MLKNFLPKIFAPKVKEALLCSSNMSKWDVFKNEESQCAFTRVDDYLSFEGQIAPTQNGSVGYCSIVSKVNYVLL